jgi:hypothetical protein
MICLKHILCGVGGNPLIFFKTRANLNVTGFEFPLLPQQNTK